MNRRSLALFLILASTAGAALAQPYRLNKEVNTAVNRADVREKLQSYGYAAEGSTPERLLEINRDDLALWRKLVREANIPLE